MAPSIQSDSLSREERETWERIVRKRRREWAQLKPSVLEGIIRVPWNKLIIQPQFESSEEKFNWLLSRYFERSVNTKVSASKRRAAFLVVKKLLEKSAAAWVSHQSEQEEKTLLQLETSATNTPNRDAPITTKIARENGSTHFESSSPQCQLTSQNHFSIVEAKQSKPAAKPQTSSAHASTSLSKEAVLATAAAVAYSNRTATNVIVLPKSKNAPKTTTTVQSSGPVSNNSQNSRSSTHFPATPSSTRNNTLLNVTLPLTAGVQARPLQHSGGSETVSTTGPGRQDRPIQQSCQGLPATSPTTVPICQVVPPLAPSVSLPTPTVDPFQEKQTLPTRTPTADTRPQCILPKPDGVSSRITSVPALLSKASNSIPTGSESVAIQTEMGSAQSLVAASKDSPSHNGSRKLDQETGERTLPPSAAISRVCTPDVALPENLPSVPREIFFPADNNKLYGGLTPRPLIRTVHTPQNMTPQGKKQIASRLATWYPYWKMEEILVLQQTCQLDSCDLRKASPVPVNQVLGCKFRLTPNQITQITGWKTHRQHPYAQDETRLLVQMLPLEEPSRHPEKGKFKARADIHQWPKGTLLSINGLPMPIYQRRQQGHDKAYWSGLSHFFDASAVIPDCRQEISVDACCYEDKPYAICIAICKFQTPAKLFDEIMGKFMDTLTMKAALQKARQMTAQNMVFVEGDEEEEAENQSFIFKLTCAISSTLMRTPVRAKRCSHFQCFDLRNFIDCNQRVTGTSWECPVCSKELISLYDLEYCPLTKSIADQYGPQVTAQRDRVEFFSDGTWKLLEEKKKRYAPKQSSDHMSDSRSAKISRIAEVIDLL